MIDIPDYVVFDPIVSFLMVYVVVHIKWIKDTLRVHGKRIKRLESQHMGKNQ